MVNMERYICLLRGINVVGKNLIRMAELRTTFERLGFGNVSTYLQSGNVLFETGKTDKNHLEEMIASEIGKDFGFQVPVLLIKPDLLKEVVDQCPYIPQKEEDFSSIYLTFPFSPVQDFNLEKLLSKRLPGEEIEVRKQAVYLYCPGGYGKTKLSNTFLEYVLGVPCTTRNLRTATELLKTKW